MSDKFLLSRDQIKHLVQMQLLYDENIDIRSYSEMALDAPKQCIKSVGLTTGFGTLATWGSSFFVFRSLKIANNDVKKALPVLGKFSAIDFGVNFALTKITGKRVPERWMSVASSSTAGACVGYSLGNKKLKPTVAGGIIGAIYGYTRNWPMDLFGFDPF